MKTQSPFNLERFLQVVLLATITFSAHAQKQPQIQVASVRAPANIKTDGKLTEWANPLLNAYNSNNRIYYVISNDDNNLYVTIRGLGTRVILKTLSNGLTFTVSHAVDKKARAKATDNVAVTFPIQQDEKTTLSIMGPVRSLTNLIDDTVANRRRIDSIVAIANKRLTDAMKYIKVKGIKEIDDSLLSVYNSEGIKAAMLIKDRQPIYELAIPLKYLGLSIDNPVKFSYNIKLHGPQDDDNAYEPNEDIVKSQSAYPSPSVTFGAPIPAGPAASGIDDVYFLDNTTSLWGIYTLIRK